MAKLVKIHRYPIKGLNGEEIDHAQLSKGAGIKDDRRFAITNGNSAIDGTNWVSPRNFLINAVDDNLLKYQLSRENEKLIIRAPNQDSLSFDPDDPASINALNQKIGKFLAPVRRRADLDQADLSSSLLIEKTKTHKIAGNWDFEDTPLSIINLETIAAISAITGTAIDPRRFRGNLLIEGLPAWHEFGLAGSKFSLGQSEIEITRPAERCPATACNPADGERDIQIPALLARHFGHGYCGIYAHVSKTGMVKTGDTLINIGPARAKHSDAQLDNAPDYAIWPKMAIVATIDHKNALAILKSATPWPLLNSSKVSGKRMRLHPGPDKIVSINITSIKQDMISVDINSADHKQFVQDISQNDKILVSGPYGKTG